MRIIRKFEVRRITGLSDPTIWRLERQSRFPRRVRLGANSVGWHESEILEWIAELPREGGKPVPQTVGGARR